MKPRFGRKVYCVYEESILAEPVYAVGKDSFLLDPHDKIEDSYEWYYEDYNETWFTDLNKAKKKLLENYNHLVEVGIRINDEVKVVKVNEDYYELRGKEE